MKGLPPSDGFEQSTMGDYRYLSAISHFDWTKLVINPELIDSLIVEQLEICQRRYKDSKLDVSEILGKNGIFGESGWSIIQGKDGIVCVNSNDRTKTKNVRFGEVDPKYAEDFHRTFHYIHAPRVDRSFGLFLEGSDTPFTVGGIEPIDRQYKKDALLIYGFDPDKFFDFTRLYSLPGVPKNASSVISSCIKAKLLEEDPTYQGAVSTFMPTYANGNSMLACGLDTAFLIKRNTHKFQATDSEYGDYKVYEQLTNRRADLAGNDEITTNKMRLLPVVEVMSVFNKNTRYEPLIKLNKEMLVKES